MDLNPTAATDVMWREFFLDLRNLQKDFKDERNFDSTPCTRMFAQVAESDVEMELRKQILSRVLLALLAGWREIDKLLDRVAVSRGAKHPARSIRLLFLVNGQVDRDLLGLSMVLWEELPREQNLHLLLTAFEDLSPISDAELEELCCADFSSYGRMALSILLDRGQIDVSSNLFRSNLAQFGDVDPLNMDWLVAKGLPIEDAKYWLDQSCNAGDGPVFKVMYQSALVRWSKLFTET